MKFEDIPNNVPFIRLISKLNESVIMKTDEGEYLILNEDCTSVWSKFPNTQWDNTYMEIVDWFEPLEFKNCTCWSLLYGHLPGCDYEISIP